VPTIADGWPPGPATGEGGTPVQLTRREVLDGTLEEYRSFVELVESIDDAGWDAPSRCEGWQVRDVAGHVVGLAEDVAKGVPGSRNGEEEAASVRGDPPATAAFRLRAAVDQFAPLISALDDDAAWASPSPTAGLSMAEGVLTLWGDTAIHADDIRAALGRPAVEGPGWRAAAAYLEMELGRRAWGPARIEFSDQAAGSGAVEVGEVGEATPTHRVPLVEFVLAATGRLDPAEVGLDPTVNVFAA
jgi:uncharacterized protein (TIGR03083 family)